MIEAHVWQMLADEGLDNMDISQTNTYLTHNIAAALKLGDLAYIGVNLDWVEGMMINYNMPVDELNTYLVAYYKSARKALTAPAGKPIINWLAQVVEICEESVTQLSRNHNSNHMVTA